MEFTSFSAAAMEATIVTAVLVASATLGFLTTLLGFRWRRLSARRRGPEAIPRWIVVHHALQQHLLQGVPQASCWETHASGESYPLPKQPQQQPDDNSTR